jgi:pimeloyl-ACP methyl ester carboxylesterase
MWGIACALRLVWPEGGLRYSSCFCVMLAGDNLQQGIEEYIRLFNCACPSLRWNLSTDSQLATITLNIDGYPPLASNSGEAVWLLGFHMFISWFCGGLDNVVCPEAQHETAKAISGCKEVIFFGEGHMMPMENPKRTALEICRFQVDV